MKGLFLPPPLRAKFSQAWEPGVLIFGLIRTCSSKFISARISAAMHVANVSLIDELLFQLLKTGKVGDSSAILD